ncbi:MAG: hypothetical protein PHX53_12025, partial [Syntrophales bacterium]|nr:hypothetical protein [Syntrophales bacterium]
MNCPRCGILIDPVQHGDLVFDEQVWCQGCHQYDDRLLEARPFPELESWAQKICAAFEQEPVHLQRDPAYLPDPAKYWHGATFLLAEACHGSR